MKQDWSIVEIKPNKYATLDYHRVLPIYEHDAKVGVHILETENFRVPRHHCSPNKSPNAKAWHPSSYDTKIPNLSSSNLAIP